MSMYIKLHPLSLSGRVPCMFALRSFLFYITLRNWGVTDAPFTKEREEKVTVNKLCLQVIFGQYK